MEAARVIATELAPPHAGAAGGHRWLIGLLLLATTVGAGLGAAKLLAGPGPPHWNDPLLYPGAANVSARSAADGWKFAGDCCTLPDADAGFAPNRQITFSAPDPPEVVLEWYRQRLTAEGWGYTATSNGGFGVMESTTGFWHYTWPDPRNPMGYWLMDVQTYTPSTGGNYVTLLLGMSQPP